MGRKEGGGERCREGMGEGERKRKKERKKLRQNTLDHANRLHNFDDLLSLDLVCIDF